MFKNYSLFWLISVHSLTTVQCREKSNVSLLSESFIVAMNYFAVVEVSK